MANLNAVSSVLPSHEVSFEEVESFLAALAPGDMREALRHVMAGNLTRRVILSADELAHLGDAAQRSELYSRHALALAERAVSDLADRGTLQPEKISTVVLSSSTGLVAPTLDTHLVRRFGLNPRCRRIPLTWLGCGGGVAALSLAAEIASHDPTQRVLIVAVEIPSLQLPLRNPSPLQILGAAQFGDGAAAAIVSNDERGPEIVGTQSVLLSETEEGGRISGSETGLRLVGAGNLPRLIRGRVGELVELFAKAHDIDPQAFSFVLAHPRGLAVLEAIAEGLSLKPSMLRASKTAWEQVANMISATIYRVFVELAQDDDPPKAGELGLMIAFGIGVACEMALLRWRSAPTVVCS